EEPVGFDRTEFHESAGFSKTQFQSTPLFHSAKFMMGCNFGGTKFSEPPQFYSAEFHQDTSFFGASFQLGAMPPSEGARAWASLRVEMNRVQKHEEELEFFALELDAKRKYEPWPRAALIVMYSLFADYGRS